MEVARGRVARALLGWLLLAGLAVLCWSRMAVTTDITHFMADESDARLAGISRQLAQSELTRTIVLSVQAEGDDPAPALAAARRLGEALAGDPEVAWLRTGPGPIDGEAIHQLYFPRRNFLLDDPKDRLSDAGLRAAAVALKQELGRPTGQIVKRVAPADPLLLYPQQLRRLEAARAGGLEVVEGQFLAEGRHALVLLATRHSPFDAAVQAPLQAAITAAASGLGEGVTLEQSGVARFALAAEHSMRADIQRISTVSLLGLVLLFALMFGSVRLIVLALLPLLAGVLAALAACLLLFGTVHGLTLAFGATLIGVCIDYSVHLFNHYLLAPAPGGPEASARKMSAGLWLGALTTIAGFAGLAWTSFPGLREVAVFASVGVLTAVVATRYWLPSMLPAGARPGRLAVLAAAGLGRMVVRLRRARGLLLALPIAAVIAAAIGVPRISFSDDIKLLTSTDPVMLAEDERVRGRVARMDSGRFVVAIGSGPDLAAAEEAALVSNDAVFAVLTAARAAGEVAEFRSLHSFVRSAAMQRASLAALQEPGLAARLDAAFVAEGFRAGSFAGFFADMSSGPGPLRPAELAGTPLAELVRSFRVELAGAEPTVAVLSLLRGVSDGAALRGRLAAVPGSHYFDQAEAMATAFAGYRARTLELVLFGLLGVFALVLLRYRRLGVAMAAFAPAVLAAGATLGVLALCGVGIGLLHVVALLLVLSMGVDYGVFLAESRGDPEGFTATLLSVVIACLSTVLAFGLLGMSDSPALRAIGVTVGLGVLLSLVLAPVAMLLGERGER
ncbi:MAG: MMPL family transporter [Nannocystis sp.]|uniref:MMPL family transporter n=1 Tax=Nannocystis sp. TaxID=1962667 RepID=UPI00242160C4|nr:MMPL family transporter [Nannocystis sp.]MBK9753480.1 MMPL family transporter [Nannocystis sp.]